MKLIDYAIIGAFIGCFFLAYAGYRLEAALAIIMAIIVASWRFWEYRRHKEEWYGSGDRIPNRHDSVSDPTDNAAATDTLDND